MELYHIDYFSLRKYFPEQMPLGQCNPFDFSTQPINPISNLAIFT